MRRFIRSKVSSDEEAEDILQDIFIRIHQGIDDLRYEDRVQSWVFGIARRALAHQPINTGLLWREFSARIRAFYRPKLIHNSLALIFESLLDQIKKDTEK